MGFPRAWPATALGRVACCGGSVLATPRGTVEGSDRFGIRAPYSVARRPPPAHAQCTACLFRPNGYDACADHRVQDAYSLSAFSGIRDEIFLMALWNLVLLALAALFPR